MTYAIRRGDTTYFRVTIEDADGPIDLTGKVLRFTAKRGITHSDVQATIRKSTGSGIELVDGETGVAEITIDPADTATLPAGSTRLLFDVQLTSGSEVFTVVSGQLFVEPDVTITQ